ncbi:MAG: hypothetical protein IPM04_10325 [Saprospiraceae bacterium]|nr:hypothetical protein [Candidatus Brachybacter algidus]MBK8748244.1 hypothetical protein [Candidatus Brachybacter algidus]
MSITLSVRHSKNSDIWILISEAVAYNSTEFNNGLNFRFRNKGKFNGSARVIVPYAVAVEIKLSDVLASSSCFPGGFEPMLWPNDFVHADSINLEKHAKNNRTVGLMDGGIYDNQGIESVLKYNSKAGEPYFDLVIVSDVSSPNMSSFKATNVDDTWFSKRTFQDFIKYNVRFNWILIGAIIALMCPLIFGLGNEFLQGICSGLAFSLIAVLIFKVWAIKKVSNKIKSSVEKLVGPNFDFYKKQNRSTFHCKSAFRNAFSSIKRSHCFSIYSHAGSVFKGGSQTELQ